MRIRHVTVLVLCTLAFSALLAGSAGAHRIDESYIYVDIYDDTVEGRLQFNARELNAVLDLGIPEDETVDAGPAARAARDQIFDYAIGRFGIGGDGQEWTVELVDLEALPTEAGNFVIVYFEIAETFDDVPDELDVRYEAFFDEVSGHIALFHIDNYWKGGSYLNESQALNTLVPFSASNTSQSFDIDDPSFWKGFRGVVVLGIDHIKIGSDHILFIVALLLPSVMVFTSRGWQPSAGFLPSLWRVVKLATMFTLAHSITLSLAGLGVFELPSRPVEVIIALSIILAALHNFWPRWANKEWGLAFAFGLFHGLGFAGLLTDLGLDRSNRVWSLLAFNVGVEVGQVAIILLVFPSIYLLRRTRLYDIGFRVGSVALAVVAGGWMLERLFEVNLRVNRLIDPVIKTPRAYWAMAVVTVIALGIRWVEGDRDRLLAPATVDGPDGSPPGDAGDDGDRVLAHSER